jgi:CHAD domain-containing protein
LDAPAFLEESGRERAARFRECRQRASADPSSDEAIHDLRVAIRRVLAWIAVRDALLSPDRRLREARSSLKKLMGPLGRLRDAHVKRDWIRKVLPAGDDPSYAYAVLVASDVLRWEGRVRERLGSPSTARLRVPVPKTAGPPGARDDIVALAGRHLRTLAAAVAGHREAALNPANPDALHRMRLSFKKFRYAAEVLLPLFPGATEETAKRLHAFQTLLGTIHDFDVILAEAGAFRRDILRLEAESALENAIRELRDRKFRVFREAAGTADGLAGILGEELRA